jgi:hypothetical protein
MDNYLVVKGDWNTYSFVIANEDYITFRNVKVNFLSDKSTIESAHETAEYSLLPSESERLDTRIKCNYRGEYHIGVDSIEVTDFLYLFSITYPIGSKLKVVVLPRIVPLEQLGIAPPQTDVKNPFRFSNMAEEELDSEVRKYSPGDARKRIHWKASARQHELISRKYQYIPKAEIVLFMDLMKIKEDDLRVVMVEDKIIESVLAIANYYALRGTPSQIIYEMKRMQDELVPAQELQMAKNYLTGNFALSLERPQTIASFAVNTERYKLPKDFYANYLKNIEAVTAADVQATAKKYILPEQSNIIVVGKASEIAESLKKFSADGKIEYYDNDANPYDPSAKAKVLPAGVTTKQVLDKYIQTVGGVDNIGKVKDITMNASLTVQGMNLLVKMIYKIPGQYLLEITMNGQTFQKQVYNKGTGKISGMQGNKVVEGEELDKMKLEAELFPELKYEAYGYKAELKEVVDVNGKEAYVIEDTSSTGKTSRDFYSVESGLKVKSESTQESQMGAVTQSTEISEYMDVNGVKYPKLMKQSAGPQTFDIKVETITVNTGIADEVFN